MGVVKKKAVLKPLAQRADHHSLFIVDDDTTTPPDYMPDVVMELVEWPRMLVLVEPFDGALAMADLPDGLTMELVRIPGNRSKGNYALGTPLMRFKKCVKMRQFSRFNGGGLELGVIFDCTVVIL